MTATDVRADLAETARTYIADRRRGFRCDPRILADRRSSVRVWSELADRRTTVRRTENRRRP